MKRFLCLLFLLLPFGAFAQPIIRHALTTNSPSVMTNVVKSLATNVVENAPLPAANLTGSVPAASLPSNLATNNGNNQFSAAQTVNGAFTNTGYSSTTTNYATKLRVGGAAETADAVNVTGPIRSSTGINAGTTVIAASHVLAGQFSILGWAGTSCQMFSLGTTYLGLIDNTTGGPRVLLGGSITTSGLAGTTNWPSLAPTSKTNSVGYAEVGVMAGTNTTEFASLKADQVTSTNRATGNSLAMTNGGLVFKIGGATTVVSGIRHGISGAMVLGSVTVTDAQCTANTRYFFSAHTLGTISIPGGYYASTRNVGTSFVIQSSQATETSTIDWMAIEP